MPILSSGAYDRFGGPYNYTNVVGTDYKFNTTAYLEYSPLYISASFMMTYMLVIALSTCAIVHTALHHGPKIYRGLKGADVEEDDIHAKLMRAYPEVPMWCASLSPLTSTFPLHMNSNTDRLVLTGRWYGVSFVVFLVLGIIAVAVRATLILPPFRVRPKRGAVLSSILT
jgi:hypothetical protein